MKRRDLLLKAGAIAAGIAALAWTSAAGAAEKTPKLLYFTRSAGFIHTVVNRHGEKLAYSEKILVELGRQHGFEVVCSQDPKIFDGDLGRYDAIAFYTTGKVISAEGKAKLLEAIHEGKGFVGIHSATDTFRIPESETEIDPYTAMIGAEFLIHASQQKARMKVVSPNFPGVKGLDGGFEMYEEWYAFRKFAPDLHVILVQQTAGMHDAPYQRPPYPATWAHMYGKGRVFYTSMGHREDVWTNPNFQQVLLGGIAWSLHKAEADVNPNMAAVTPGANQLKN
jgi:type 1 glutamine amidotransferase